MILRPDLAWKQIHTRLQRSVIGTLCWCVSAHRCVYLNVCFDLFCVCVSVGGCVCVYMRVVTVRCVLLFVCACVSVHQCVFACTHLCCACVIVSLHMSACVCGCMYVWCVSTFVSVSWYHDVLCARMFIFTDIWGLLRDGSSPLTGLLDASVSPIDRFSVVLLVIKPNLGPLAGAQ